MISVVIPTLNEGPRLGALLTALAGEASPHEVIIVDGGSGDETLEVARQFETRILERPSGRGQQLRAGAESSTGDIILFLHADSQFPVGGLDRIAQELAASPERVGGNFRLQFDGDGKFSRWLNGFYAWIRSHGFYYGDSGIFVRRYMYDHLGGIRPIALMEDYDFVRRMESTGETVCIEDPALKSSSRRFEGRHPVAIVWGWLVIHLLFHLGVSPDWLARFYDSTRRREAATHSV